MSRKIAQELKQDAPAKANSSRKSTKAQSKTADASNKRVTSAPTSKSSHVFSPTLGELDLHLFGEGRHEHIYEKLGAHVSTHEGKRGVRFAAWAPNAKGV